MLLHAPTKSILLKARDPFQLREILPKSRLLDHGDYNIAVKHTVESTRVLRNIGVDAPAPIRAQYNWPGKYTPFDHQYEMAEFLTLHRRAFNLSEMGTGKTAATLWATDWLMKQGLVGRTLVLSPLSTLDRVWRNDIFDVLMHRTVSVVHGDREKREAALKRMVDFYLLNHDGISIDWIREHLRKRADINHIIIDEASMFRNHDTTKYKSLRKVIREDTRVWLLTGTPCPNSPTDAWALAKLVAPHKVPEYFGSFKRQTMMQVSQFKWLAKPDAYNVAYAAMQPAVRFRKKDCLTLPPVIMEDREAKLTKEQLVAFNTMRQEMQAEAKTTTITAVNAADKIGKLRQILCGAIKDPESGKYITYPHAPRTTVLLEAIEQAAAKVYVIVPFKGIIAALEHEVSKHFSCAVVNGDVSPKARNRIFQAFKEEKDPHVLLCHPKVVSHGLNFTEADMVIFYGPIYSNDEFEQVIERFNRAGQTRKMTIIRIGAHSLEWAIYGMVDNKRVTQSNILNLYKSITE